MYVYGGSDSWCSVNDWGNCYLYTGVGTLCCGGTAGLLLRTMLSNIM